MLGRYIVVVAGAGLVSAAVGALLSVWLSPEAGPAVAFLAGLVIVTVATIASAGWWWP